MERGKMQRYVETLIWGVLGFWILVSIYGFIRDYPGYDVTDDAVNGVRSGMTLHIDHETGCHYLGRFFGGVTPRLDWDGSHICK